MTADLSALIARLEAAEVGSRELDHLIFMHTAPVDVASHWSPSDRMTFFTTSLDAALALAERVLPNYTATLVVYRTSGGKFPPHATANLLCPYGEITEYLSSAPTPALALCIAILRAKQGEGE